MKTTFTLFALVLSLIMFGQSDDCASAPSLTVGSSCVAQPFSMPTNFNMNFSSGAMPCATDFKDAFFKFTATSTSTTISAIENELGPDVGLMVMSGTCGGTLTILGCSDAGNDVQEDLTVATTIGQIYYIVLIRTNNAGANDMTGSLCIYNSPIGSVCESAETLPLNSTLCNTNDYYGSFPGDGSSPVNGCNSNYNDGEYWYKVVGTGQALNIELSSLSGTYSGIFVYDNCPSSGNCIANAVAGLSSANYSVNTPILTNGQTYYIVVANWGPPYYIDFCIKTSITSLVSASDCPQYVDVCTDLGFQIDPNGAGLINEIPPSGSLGNPYYNGITSLNPWGTNHQGCLQVDEKNSTWMVINISGSGNLEFTFGGNNAQNGFYDWIMYPYTDLSTCNAITSNTVAPVRCNWNSSSSGGTGLASTLPSGGFSGNFEPPLAVTAGQKYIICFSNYSNSSTNVPLQFGGTAVVSCQPLGVNLFDYTVDCEENEHLLEWKTSHEENFSHFEVQRMNEQQQWEIMSQINNPVQEEGTTRVYRFQIEARTTEIQYYRLKMIDVNGDFEYSDIKSVLCSKTIQNNTLAPNPSKDFTNLIYYSNSIGTLEIMDQTGRLIQHYTLENTEKRMVEKAIDVQDLKEGVYYFMLNIDDQVTTLPFIKQ